MPRLMSVMLTEDAVRDQTKTETRRTGWSHLRAGEHLTLVRKAMGLRKGEKVVRICTVRVLSVGRQRLDAITDQDVAAEGFGPDRTTRHPWLAGQPWNATPREWFLAFFAHHMGCGPDETVTVIKWEYLPAPATVQETLL